MRRSICRSFGSHKTKITNMRHSPNMPPFCVKLCSWLVWTTAFRYLIFAGHILKPCQKNNCFSGYLRAMHMIVVSLPNCSTLALRQAKTNPAPTKARRQRRTPNLRTKIIDFRGFDSSIVLIWRFQGWNSQAHSGFPGKFESSNLSRDNLSTEIGRSPGPVGDRGGQAARRQARQWSIDALMRVCAK